jgi:hypothetical protein
VRVAPRGRGLGWNGTGPAGACGAGASRLREGAHAWIRALSGSVSSSMTVSSTAQPLLRMTRAPSVPGTSRGGPEISMGSPPLIRSGTRLPLLRWPEPKLPPRAARRQRRIAKSADALHAGAALHTAGARGAGTDRIVQAASGAPERTSATWGRPVESRRCAAPRTREERGRVAHPHGRGEV